MKPADEQARESLTVPEIREQIDQLAATLTTPRKRFCDEYLANGENGTRAYLKVFKTNKAASASVGATRLMKRADVRAYIELCKQFTTDELLNHLTITDERILDEEARLAFADFRQIFDKDGNIRPPQFWPDDISKAVSGIEIVQTWDSHTENWKFVYKIKWLDKGAALKRLETIRGMYKLPELQDQDKELIKSFFESIDGMTRGKLPSELMDEDDDDLEKYKI